MNVKCVQNRSNNTNFTEGQEYEMSKIGIRSNLGGMWIYFEEGNRPRQIDIGSFFEFAMCAFLVV